MKRACLFGAFCLIATVSILSAADSVSFAETYSETLVQTGTTPAPDYEKSLVDKLSITATVNLPGLAEEEIDDNTEMGFELKRLDEEGQSFSFTSSVRWASRKSANSWTFIFTDEDIDTGKITELSRAVFTRRGEILQVTYTTIEYSATFAGAHLAQAGPFKGQLEFNLYFGFLDKQTTLFYSGSTRITSRTVGSGTNQQTINMASVQLTGTADFTPPTVAITKPARNFRSTNDLVTVLVRATDAVGVGFVGLRSNPEDDYEESVPVPGVLNSWTGAMNLVPGTNTIQALCRDLAGNEAATEIKVVYVVMAPIQLIVESPGGGTVQGIVNGQFLEVNRTYTVTAKPASGYVFGGWTGTVESPDAGLAFVMREGLELRATFVPNPFKPFTGTYNGLFIANTQAPASNPVVNTDPGASTNDNTVVEPSSAITPTNSGFLTLTLTGKGIASGKIMLAGQSIGFSSVQFNGYGKARMLIGRKPPLTPLSIQLNLDLANTNGVLRGQVADAQWTSDLTAFLVKGHTNFTGRYTFALPGGDNLQPLAEADTNSVPGGDGSGTMTIDTKGTVKLTGNLGDGTVLSASGGLSYEELWPIYVSLQQGKGILLGWGRMTPHPTLANRTVLTGPVRWLKSPTLPTIEKFYPNGFALNAQLTGAQYVAPARNQPWVNWTNGIFHAAGGNLDQPLEYAVQFQNNKTVIVANTNNVTLSVSASTGSVSGSFKHPVLKKTVILKGALLQWPEGGYQVGGWFRGTNQSGHVYLGPPEN
jgi:hypothetical protein